MDSPERLRALDASSTLRFLARRKIPPWVVILVSPLVLLVIVGVIAATQGTLFHTAGLATLVQDTASLVSGKASISDEYFPLSRDYPTVVVLVSTGITVGLVYRNVLLMEQFLPELRKNRVLVVRTPNISRAENALRKVNVLFSRIRKARPLVLAVSVIVAMLLMIAAKSGDTFRPLVGASDNDALYAAAYDGWWASVSRQHWLGAVTYLLGATFIVYVIIKHNLIGTCFVSFFVLSRGAIDYKADKRNLDGYRGWRVMRNLMITILSALLVSLVAFGSLFILLPITSAPWTAPFLLLYFVGLPTDVLAPTLLLRSEMARFKEREINDILRNTDRVRQELKPYSLAWYELNAAERAEIEFVQDLRPRLFRTRTVALASVLYVLPAITSIASVILSYMQVSR